MRRLFALVVLGSMLAGCELLVDFDRSKIPPAERPDAGLDAAAPRDAGEEPGDEDAGDEDAG